MKNYTAAIALIYLFIFETAYAGVYDCGSLENHFGPYDYYDPRNHMADGSQSEGRVGIVEKRHLTQSMFMLDKGSTGSIAWDLHYTLMAVPNHPRALDLASNLNYQRKQWPRLAKRHEKLRMSIECYFDRAFRLNPERGAVHMIYGIHKHRNSDYEGAVAAYQKAETLEFSDPQLDYNLALTLVELKQYEEAMRIANELYSNGFPLMGLQKALKKVGEWREQ